MRILILCTGNSCRSKMANGLLQSFDKGIEVYSAGTEPAKEVNTMDVEVMAEAGVEISNHTQHDVAEYTKQAWA